MYPGSPLKYSGFNSSAGSPFNPILPCSPERPSLPGIPESPKCPYLRVIKIEVYKYLYR